MLVGQGINIANGKAWACPTGVGAVCSVVGETDTGTQRSVAVGIGAVAELIDILKTMFGIVVVVGGITNGCTTNLYTPASSVLTSDYEDVVQIAPIWHGVLLIFQSLVEHGCHLRHVFGRETAVKHIHKLVAVNT